MGTKRCVYFLILAFFCEHFPVSLYKIELNNDILIKAVEIVHENWEAAYFYSEMEASIFDAKIKVNLSFRQNIQVCYW